MSFFSAFILPKIESQLVDLTPELTEFAFGLLKSVAIDLNHWLENKGDSKKPETMIKNGDKHG